MDDQSKNQDSSPFAEATGDKEVTEVEEKHEAESTMREEAPAEEEMVKSSEPQAIGAVEQASKDETADTENQEARGDTESEEKDSSGNENEVVTDDSAAQTTSTDQDKSESSDNSKWYVVHTYSGHENKVAAALKQRIESEHLEHKILDILVPSQEKIEIRGGKKTQVKEKIFPGYILVKMVLDDSSWLAVRTTQGVTSFVGIGNKPTPIPEHEVKTIVKYMEQGPAQTFKDIFSVDDTIKIIDGPFADFIGKIDSVDKEKGKVRVLVSIFGRETPVELDFLQVQKL